MLYFLRYYHNRVCAVRGTCHSDEHLLDQSKARLVQCGIYYLPPGMLRVAMVELEEEELLLVEHRLTEARPHQPFLPPAKCFILVSLILVKGAPLLESREPDRYHPVTDTALQFPEEGRCFT